jgi:hypothetical protein
MLVCGYCASFAFWMTAHPQGAAHLRSWQIRSYLWGGAFGVLLLIEIFLMARLLASGGKSPESPPDPPSL